MKTVLCYGDSNTWGYNAATLGRFGYDERWTGVLRHELGQDFYVVEEGLNGRTTVWPDPIEGEHKNGKPYLWPCLESHYPIDLVILMLGTNDSKHRFGLSAWDIASGAGTLVEMITKSPWGPEDRPPQVLLVAPVLVVDPKPDYAPMLEGAAAKSLGFAEEYHKVAELYGCHYLNAAAIATPDPLDGIHLTAEAHQALGKAMAACVRQILDS